MAYLDGIKEGDKCWFYPQQAWITYQGLNRGSLCHIFLKEDGKEILCNPDGRLALTDKIPMVLLDKVEVLDPNNLPQRPYQPKKGEFVEWGIDGDRRVGKVTSVPDLKFGYCNLIQSDGGFIQIPVSDLKPYKPQKGDLVVGRTRAVKFPIIIGKLTSIRESKFQPYTIESDGNWYEVNDVEPFIGHKPTML